MNKKCQVFTPQDYVEKILDEVGYISNLYGKKVLENSCGDGNILAKVVERYIADCKARGISRTKIKNGLKRDIIGFEIDKEQSTKCIERLNKILEDSNIQQITWQIYTTDYLKKVLDQKFDYIVGNPPYITYSEMKSSEQKYLRKHFAACKEGKFDYCYAFIEKSLTDLSIDGKMAYLIPVSIFKTVFGEKLRCIMSPYVRKIIEYTQDGGFDEAFVKTAIIVLEKNKSSQELQYIDDASGIRRDIRNSQLNSKWMFNEVNVGNYRFGDYFKVSHVVATLLNKAFVLSGGEETETSYIVDDFHIEKTVVRATDTPKNRKYGRNERIIFPYYYTDGKLCRYTDEQFTECFPETSRYLNTYRDDLMRRKSDKSALWFEYGRSQALAGINKRKLLVSTVVSSRVEVYELSADSIPYAGMYIVPITDDKEMDLQRAREILESDEFFRYVQNIGIHINGNSVRVTSKDIENYHFKYLRS